MGHAKPKGVFEHAQNAGIQIHPTHAQSLIRTFAGHDSVRGQWRPWSDCVDGLVDLGLCCLHMPEDIFSHGTAQTLIWLLILTKAMQVFQDNYLLQTASIEQGKEEEN